MKIGLRGGHSPNCKGAIGLIDEQAEVRKIYNELAPMLQLSAILWLIVIPTHPMCLVSCLTAQIRRIVRGAISMSPCT